jgi:predicted naringenin-chalcone synthase
MTEAYINRIATAVPPHDVHEAFLRFGRHMLRGDNRRTAIFDRLARRSEISHRYSFLRAAPPEEVEKVDADGFYRFGHFPGTAARMRQFERHASGLAVQAVNKVLAEDDRNRVTHLIVTSCTGLSAPGIDLDLVGACGLRPDIERYFIGFMGCYAAINALKMARHIVRSDPQAQVLTVNLELCTLHLHETAEMEEMLSFLLFGDGCAAGLVSAEPKGVAMEAFHAALVPQTEGLIRWHIRDQGFDMLLSGAVPDAIRGALSLAQDEILGGRAVSEIDLWAVHPGGRTVLDAVEQAFALRPDDLAASRNILNNYGNMSSGTVMFVLDQLMRTGQPEAKGCAMAFGPGLVAETMRFRMAA